MIQDTGLNIFGFQTANDFCNTFIGLGSELAAQKNKVYAQGRNFKIAINVTGKCGKEVSIRGWEFVRVCAIATIQPEGDRSFGRFSDALFVI